MKRRSSQTTIFAALAAALLALSPSGAQAQSSAWAENEGGRMRLVVMPADGDGKRDAVLEIEPKPGWITYWREPGDSGIPPQIAAEPASPYSFSPMGFPVPKVIVAGEIIDIGYDQPVRLPFGMRGPAAGNLKATAFVGLCRNICIPFQADFAMALSAVPMSSPEEAELVDKARAALPPGPSADFSVRASRWAKDLKRLDIALQLPGIHGEDKPQIILTGPEGYVFTGFDGKADGAGRYDASFPIEKLPHGYQPQGKQWGVLVIDGDRAMETQLAFD